MVTIAPLFLPIGPAEAAIVFLIAVLFFGADRIPKLARAFGESMGKFQEGKQKAQEEVDEITAEVTEEPDPVGSDPETEGKDSDNKQSE